MTDSDNGVAQHLAVLAKAFIPYKHLTVRILNLVGEAPKLRVLPNAIPQLAEDIVCVPDCDRPGAMAFLFSWGSKIPGNVVAEQAAAVAYVLQVDNEDMVDPAEPSAEFMLSLTAEERAVGPVRRLVIGALQLWGLECLVDQASIVISELSTNAVHEAPGEQIRIRVVLQNGGVRLECWDPSPRLPAVAALPAADALGGRGLYIVQALSAEHGVTQEPGTTGKTAWALCLPE